MSSYLLVLFVLSSSQRGDLSVAVEELFRLSGRLRFPWAGFVGQRSPGGRFSTRCWGSRGSTHTRTLLPTNVRSVKSMKLSFPMLVTRFHILSSANPPPASRRGIPTWSCPTSRISKTCVHLALSECVARDSVTFPEGPAAPGVKATAAIVTAASLGLAQSQSEQNG